MSSGSRRLYRGYRSYQCYKQRAVHAISDLNSTPVLSALIHVARSEIVPSSHHPLGNANKRHPAVDTTGVIWGMRLGSCDRNTGSYTSEVGHIDLLLDTGALGGVSTLHGAEVIDTGNNTSPV